MSYGRGVNAPATAAAIGSTTSLEQRYRGFGRGKGTGIGAAAADALGVRSWRQSKASVAKARLGVIFTLIPTGLFTEPGAELHASGAPEWSS